MTHRTGGHRDVLVTLLLLATARIASGQPEPTWYLRFPLPNRTAYSVQINCVMDHAMAGSYVGTGKSIAFTGELGEGTDRSLGATIQGKTLYGYKNALGTPFLVNGNYFGDNSPTYLYYEGHPGYDFRTTDQPPGTGLAPGRYVITLQDSKRSITITVDLDGTPHCSGDPNDCRGRIAILAPADGTVEECAGEGPGCLRIDHANGIKTVYLHTDQPSPPFSSPGLHVTAGSVIGVSSGTGDFPPHLHFEVKQRQADGAYSRVDPYGWQGQYPDPILRRSMDLWTPPRQAATGVRWHPDGTLITSDRRTFYVIQGGKRRGIPSESIFYSYGFDIRNAIFVNTQELQCLPLGSNLASPPSPRLIRYSGAVFEITDQHKQRAFAKGEHFQSLGYRWSEIVEGDPNLYDADPDLPTYTSPFRDGQLVRSRSSPTVYVIANAKKLGLDSASFTDLGYSIASVIVADDTVIQDIPAEREVMSTERIRRCASTENASPAPPTGLQAIIH